MHEFGITSRIVEAVTRVADEHAATRVLAVDLLIGQLTFLSVPQVKTAYEILTKGTRLEGSELSIQESPGLVECSDCHRQREVTLHLEDGPDSLTAPLPLFACAECGGKVIIVRGKECEVTGVRLETDEED